MTANLLSISKDISASLTRYLVFIVGLNQHDCNIILFGDSNSLSNEILKADFWLIDAWNFTKNDPEGFRTAYKLAGTIKCLLLFYNVPEGFPGEGKFWCNPLKCNLQEKIKEVLENPPPEKADFEKLIKVWPELAKEPKHHHR